MVISLHSVGYLTRLTHHLPDVACPLSMDPSDLCHIRSQNAGISTPPVAKTTATRKSGVVTHTCETTWDEGVKWPQNGPKQAAGHSKVLIPGEMSRAFGAGCGMFQFHAMSRCRRPSVQRPPAEAKASTRPTKRVSWPHGGWNHYTCTREHSGKQACKDDSLPEFMNFILFGKTV